MINQFVHALSLMVQKKEVTIDGKQYIFGVNKNNYGIIVFPDLDTIFTGIEFDGTFEEFIEREIEVIKRDFSSGIKAPILN